MVEALPVLLPSSSIPSPNVSEWRPTQHLQPPQPPPADDRQDLALAAAARQMIDGKALKKTRPRRTVDYGGAMGRWILVRDSSNKAFPLYSIVTLVNRTVKVVPILRLCHKLELLLHS